MTVDELEVIKEILQWAKGQVRSDGLFVRIKLASNWIQRDITLKTMDPRKYSNE